MDVILLAFEIELLAINIMTLLILLAVEEEKENKPVIFHSSTQLRRK